MKTRHSGEGRRLGLEGHSVSRRDPGLRRGDGCASVGEHWFALAGGEQQIHPLDDLALAVGALGGDVAHRRSVERLIERESVFLDLPEHLDRALALVANQGHHILNHEGIIAQSPDEANMDLAGTAP